MSKKAATIIYYSLLLAGLFFAWKAIGVASDAAYSGHQPSLKLGVLMFFLTICLVISAIYVKIKFTK